MGMLPSTSHANALGIYRAVLFTMEFKLKEATLRPLIPKVSKCYWVQYEAED